jgi:hypothetical protein
MTDPPPAELTAAPCYLCEREAVSRCYTCGQLICDRHGKENCVPCDSALVAGDPRGVQYNGTGPRFPYSRPGWWRPQQAEDYEPPACYACNAIARRTCRNCGDRYCPDHAGPSGLCQACGRSSWLGVFFFVFALAMMALILFMNLFGETR